jgi:hypothetical protein
MLAGGDPLELAVVMDEPDAAAAGARVAKRAGYLAGKAADAALLLFLVSEVFFRREHLLVGDVGGGHW